MPAYEHRDAPKVIRYLLSTRLTQGQLWCWTDHGVMRSPELHKKWVGDEEIFKKREFPKWGWGESSKLGGNWDNFLP